jgi:gas vesicle protein
MSYAGPSRSSGSTRSSRAAARPPSAHATASTQRPEELPETDWGQVALFGAGLALGITLGAGTALLTAPRTGAETRAVLRGRAGRLRRTATRRGHDAWDDLRDELRDAARALKRRKAKRAAASALRREIEQEPLID